jgi:PHP family Zn ribbon phosphoesterase
MVLEALAPWAKVKGIGLLATGDFTHPEWLFLMKEKLEPMGNGFLRLKTGTTVLDAPPFRGLPVLGRPIAFILSSELSFIYSKGGKVRKVHVMVLAPDFESVERINRRLQAVGNLVSDGRPILGLDVRLFCRMVAETAPRAVVIPSHIWTPWFSLFGANSGFDTIEECFEEMTPSIFALETGLSSDPPMNGRLSALDRFALVSNSDAHSPSKIGREANVFDTDFSYRGLIDALRTNDPAKFLATVEFFPEEGKYHYDGHRKCGEGRPGRVPYRSLIPLNEIIAEALGKTPECQGVWDLYFRFIREFGDEHTILTEVPVADLARVSPERVPEAVDRMRKGQVSITPGHDGEYGQVRIFGEGPAPESCPSQMSLF